MNAEGSREEVQGHDLAPHPGLVSKGKGKGKKGGVRIRRTVHYPSNPLLGMYALGAVVPSRPFGEELNPPVDS